MISTNRIAQHYDGLTPLERVALIGAAAIRGDDVDHQRLIDAAPRQQWQLPDHFGTSLALSEITHLHVVDMLELLATYWQAEAERFDPCTDQLIEIVEQVRQYTVFKIAVHRAAWLTFCDELGIDPVAGCELISRLVTDDDGIPLTDATDESIRTDCPLIFTGPDVQPLTVADVLETYRQVFNRRESMWK